MTRTEEIEIVLKYIGSLKQLRPIVHKQDLDWIKRVYDNIGTLLKEKEEAFELEKLEIEEQELKRQEMLKMLEEQGWTLEALMTPATANKRKRPTSSVKYQYIDKQGNITQWSGKGRMPFALKEIIEKENVSLEDFLVK